MVNFSTEKRTWVKWKWSPLWSSDWIKSGIRFCNLIWKTYCIIIICDHRWRSSISRWFVRRHKKNKSNSHFLSLNDCILHPVSVTATPPLGLYHFCLWWVTPCHTDLFFSYQIYCAELNQSRAVARLPCLQEGCGDVSQMQTEWETFLKVAVCSALRTFVA